MPLAMLCFHSKSISDIVVSIMNFTLKLAYQYKLTEKKRLITRIYCCYLLYYVAYQDLKKEENCSKISSVYIISIEKKILVYMHIVIYGSVLWLTRPSRKT